MTQADNIKLLAFVTAFKQLNRNSVLMNDAVYKQAQRLRMSVGAYKIWLKLAKECGLIYYSGKNLQARGLVEVMDILFPHRTDLRHLHFYKFYEKTSTWQELVYRIEFAFARINYEQKAYQAEYKKPLVALQEGNRLYGGQYQRLKKLQKKAGFASIEQLKEKGISEKNVVTGKNHTAKLIGKSSSTGSRRLRKWTKEGKIHRTIEHGFIPSPVTHKAHDALKEAFEGKYPYLWPDFKRGGDSRSLWGVK